MFPDDSLTGVFLHGPASLRQRGMNQLWMGDNSCSTWFKTWGSFHLSWTILTKLCLGLADQINAFPSLTFSFSLQHHSIFDGGISIPTSFWWADRYFSPLNALSACCLALNPHLILRVDPATWRSRIRAHFSLKLLQVCLTSTTNPSCFLPVRKVSQLLFVLLSSVLV